MFVLIIAVLIIHSCKKDKLEQAKAINTINPAISQAKQWYDSTFTSASSNSKQSTQSVGSRYRDWSKKFLPYWAGASIFSQDGLTFIELPAIKKGDMALAYTKPKDTANFDFGRSGTLTHLLIVKQQNNLSMYAMTILADTSYLKGDYSKLAHNSYQSMDSNFTGAVLFNQMDGTFVNGWRYRNGVVTSRLSFAPSGSMATQNTNRLKVDVTQPIPPGCGAIVVVTLWEDCSYYTSDVTDSHPFNCYTYTTTDVYADCSNSTSPVGGTTSGGSAPPPPPCVPPPAVPPTTPPANSTASVKGKLIINIAQPLPGSGGTTTPPPPLQPCITVAKPVTTTTTTPKITDSIKNACLHAMVEATISGNVTNQINSIIQNVFGGSTTMNITFIDVNNLPANVDGYTNINGGIVNGSLNIQIQLDNNHLPSYSQQYIARVIMHEALHAYLTANNMLGNLQHEDMMVNYVTKIASSLQQMFPGLSSIDAKNLALGGLQPSATFQTTIETDMGLLGSFEATNLAYSIGPGGLRCPNN